MAEFMKHYEVLHNKAQVDLKAAQNLYQDIISGDEDLDYEVILFHLHLIILLPAFGERTNSRFGTV